MKRLTPQQRKNDYNNDGNYEDLNDEGGTSIHRLAEYTHIIMDEIHERDKSTGKYYEYYKGEKLSVVFLRSFSVYCEYSSKKLTTLIYASS